MPIGHEDTAHAGSLQGADEAVISGKIDKRGAVKGERRANKSSESVGACRKVAQPYRSQFQRHLIAGRPARFGTFCLRIMSDREAHEFPGYRRSELARCFRCDSRPEKRHGTKLSIA